MLHEMGELDYGLKSQLLLQSSLPVLRTMLPMYQPQQDPLPGVVLEDCRPCLILDVLPSAGLNCLPVLEEGQEPPRLGT